MTLQHVKSLHVRVHKAYSYRILLHFACISVSLSSHFAMACLFVFAFVFCMCIPSWNKRFVTWQGCNLENLISLPDSPDSYHIQKSLLQSCSFTQSGENLNSRQACHDYSGCVTQLYVPHCDISTQSITAWLTCVYHSSDPTGHPPICTCLVTLIFTACFLQLMSDYTVLFSLRAHVISSSLVSTGMQSYSAVPV